MDNYSYHENLQRGTPDFPIAYYQVDRHNPKYQMQTHWHKEYEIIRVDSGEFRAVLNGKIFTLNEGEGLLIPGGIIHGGEADNCLYECIVFSAGILYTVQKCRSLVKNYIQNPVKFTSEDDIDGIFRLFKNKAPGYEFAVISKLYRFAGEIVEKHPESTVIPNEKFEKIKAAISMIEENYSRKISLDELASACRMSPNYFSRFFKDITGQTPFEYIITYRIGVACEMLCDSSDSITDICYKCGFNDLSYFIHIFKKHMGVPPKAYSRRHNV